MRSKLTSRASLPVAVFLAMLAPSARAQIETYDTVTSYGNTGSLGQPSGVYSIAGGTAFGQTFTNVLEMDDLTFQFVSASNGTSTSGSSTSLTAYLVGWNTSTNTVISGAPLFTQSFTIPPTNDTGEGGFTAVSPDDSNAGNSYGAFALNLTVDTILNPSDTYAMMLIDTTGSNTDLGIETVWNDYPFTSGELLAPFQVPSLGSLTILSPLEIGGTALGFSQISVVPEGNVIPSPEPRTAAVALCGLFVTILVGRRLYLYRKGLVGAAGATAA
jgi:hypothetical protein